MRHAPRGLSFTTAPVTMAELDAPTFVKRLDKLYSHFIKYK